MQLPDIATEARDFWVWESELKEFCESQDKAPE